MKFTVGRTPSTDSSTYLTSLPEVREVVSTMLKEVAAEKDGMGREVVVTICHPEAGSIDMRLRDSLTVRMGPRV
jgi:hypothetical protein